MGAGRRRFKYSFNEVADLREGVAAVLRVAASLLLAVSVAAGTLPTQRARSPHGFAASAVAVCFAGQVRTFFEDDVQAHLHSALLDKVTADLFFDLSPDDGGQKAGTCSGGAAWNGDKQLTAARIRQLFPGAVSIRVQSNSELTNMSTWRSGFHVPYPPLTFRWARCMDDIQLREADMKVQYKFVIRMRPDLIWTCVMPSVDLWPPGDVFFSHDFAVIMRRSHVGVMRMNPGAYGFWPCDDHIYQEDCQFAYSLRDGDARVRWLAIDGCVSCMSWLHKLRRACSPCEPTPTNNGICRGNNATFVTAPVPVPTQTCNFTSTAMRRPQDMLWVANRILHHAKHLPDAMHSSMVLKESFIMGL